MKIEDIKKAADIAGILQDLKEAREKLRKSGQTTYFMKGSQSGGEYVSFRVGHAELADFLSECELRRIAELRALGVDA